MTTDTAARRGSLLACQLTQVSRQSHQLVTPQFRVPIGKSMASRTSLIVPPSGGARRASRQHSALAHPASSDTTRLPGGAPARTASICCCGGTEAAATAMRPSTAIVGSAHKMTITSPTAQRRLGRDGRLLTPPPPASLPSGSRPSARSGSHSDVTSRQQAGPAPRAWPDRRGVTRSPIGCWWRVSCSQPPPRDGDRARGARCGHATR